MCELLPQQTHTREEKALTTLTESNGIKAILELFDLFEILTDMFNLVVDIAKEASFLVSTEVVSQVDEMNVDARESFS